MSFDLNNFVFHLLILIQNSGQIIALRIAFYTYIDIFQEYQVTAEIALLRQEVKLEMKPMMIRLDP